MFSKKGRFSLIVVIASALILVFHNYQKSSWQNLKAIQNDVNIYYSYLPATFIQNDPLFERKSQYDSLNRYWTLPTPTGKEVPKMTMGVALLQIPFFFLGDLYAKINPKYANDGFSQPYQYAICFSTVFYMILGLIFLWAYLKNKFHDLIVAFVIIFIAFGTNLYLYSIYSTGMSHPFTFCLFSMALFLSESWINNKKYWKSFLLGIILGWVVLIRPINILFIIPIVILLKNSQISWKSFFKTHFLDTYKHFLLFILGGTLICLPQFIFWKIQTGHFLYYSYNNEGFFWLKPHVWDGLFSFRKGWFIYTPMMLLASFGLIRLFKTKKQVFLALAIFLPLFFYVTFSWWCWWYGGGFSARTLIDILPLMALPLAAIIEWMFQKKLRLFLFVFPCFFIYLNLFQSWQLSKGILHYDSMTWEGYKTVFFKDFTPIGYWKQLDVPDYENAKKYGEEKIIRHIK